MASHWSKAYTGWPGKDKGSQGTWKAGVWIQATPEIHHSAWHRQKHPAYSWPGTQSPVWVTCQPQAASMGLLAPQEQG